MIAKCKFFHRFHLIVETLNIFITIFIRVCKYNVVNFEDGRHDPTNGLIAADHCLCAGSGDLYLGNYTRSIFSSGTPLIGRSLKIQETLALHTGQEEGETIAHLITRVSMQLQKRLAAMILNRIPSHAAPDAVSDLMHKGLGLSAKLGKHSAFWGKFGTALQAYTLNPCTKFPPNPTSRKVNT